MKIEAKITPLERRILDISHLHGLSHLGSCLSSVNVIDEIYGKIVKNDMNINRDKFVLSSGHAGVALYVVLEKYYGADPEGLLEACGIHPDRSGGPYIDCSTGSLGQGLPIALGMAMANPERKVYCLVSDGECAEGSIYEALNVKRKYSVDNLIVYVNYNGYAAYDKTVLDNLKSLPDVIVVDTSDHWFIQQYGQEAHYKVLKDIEYEEAVC